MMGLIQLGQEGSTCAEHSRRNDVCAGRVRGSINGGCRGVARDVEQNQPGGKRPLDLAGGTSSPFTFIHVLSDDGG